MNNNSNVLCLRRQWSVAAASSKIQFAFFIRCVLFAAWNNLIAHVSIRIEIDQSVFCCFLFCRRRFTISIYFLFFSIVNIQFNDLQRSHNKQKSNNQVHTSHGAHKNTHTHWTGIDLFNLIEMATVSAAGCCTDLRIYDVVVVVSRAYSITIRTKSGKRNFIRSRIGSMFVFFCWIFVFYLFFVYFDVHV